MQKTSGIGAIMVFFLAVSTLLCFGGLSAINMSDDEVNLTLSNLLNGYDVRLRPDYLGNPVQVTIEATILSLKSLDSLKMMYNMELFFRQRWRDYRLQHKLDQNLTLTVGTKHPADLIWTPDTVFINSAISDLFYVTVNNHHIDISPSGEVFWGTRVSISPKCFPNLLLYPMDIQTCQIEIVSYGYNVRHLQYQWNPNKPLIVMDKQMNQFEMNNFSTKSEIKVYTAGNFSYLTASFEFQRLMGFAILQIYVPAIAIVVISWISLWIRRDVPPARVSLCITALLTISTVWSSVNSQLPRLNYIKAVDVYLMVAFGSVIFTLIEYALVLNSDFIGEVWRERKKHMITKKNKKEALTQSKQEAKNKLVYRGNREKPETKVNIEKDKVDLAKKISAENERIAEKIEHLARIIFPLTFVVFNIFYWTIFLLN